MNIVVLDGYTLNPGDLKWDGFEKLGNFTYYHRTPEELVVERAKDAEIVIVNKTPISKDTLDRLPKCKYIGVLATGYNIVDYEYAASLGIPVCNVPTYGTESVAQHTFALILEICNEVGIHSESVKNGHWNKCEDFCYWNKPLFELSGKTIGIIGFGRIGKQVAKIAEAFGMEVLAYSRHINGLEKFSTAKAATIDEILKNSDIVSLHCPLFKENENLINYERLCTMKDTSIIINTSRGKLVVEEDLARALNEGKIMAAGVDVVPVEPPRSESPLYTAKNVYITPHIAWATKEARIRLMDIAVENLKAFLGGNPVNIVNM